MNLRVAAMGITYDRIPGVVFRKKGISVDRRARSECESVCNSCESAIRDVSSTLIFVSVYVDKTCRSYSYNNQDEECIWSMESFKYSVDDMFYLKKRDQSGHLYLWLSTPFIASR